MNRKITAFAFAGKCGSFGAGGSRLSAASNSLSKPRIRREPATADCTNPRRETTDMALLHEEEFVAGKENPGQGGPCDFHSIRLGRIRETAAIAVKEDNGERAVFLRGRPLQCDAEQLVD